MKMVHRIGISFLLIVVGSFIALSLISYSPTDPSYIFDTTKTVACQNYCGFYGAFIASVLLYGLAAASWGVVLLLFILSLVFINIIDPYKHGDKLVALTILTLGSATLGAFYNCDYYKGIEPGGYMGISIKNILYAYLPYDIALLFLYVVLFANVIIVTQKYSIKLIFLVGYVLRKIPYKFLLYRTIYSFFSISSACCRWVKSFLISLWDEQSYIEYNKADNYSILEDSFWHDYIPSCKDLSSAQEIKLNNRNNLNNISVAQHLSKSSEESSNNKSDIKARKKNYKIPHVLYKKKQDNTGAHSDQEKERAQALQQKLEQFGIKGTVVSIISGPVVTLFEYKPAVDTKISTILARQDDLALALSALSLRIIAPIPGKAVVGFEVAHDNREMVSFSELINSRFFKNYNGMLPLVIGKDIRGEPLIIDLVDQPHMLIAGSTGSGKSVGLNSIIMSLLCAQNPDLLKLILIDPKRLEFSCYKDIAHLLFPVITDPRYAVKVLKWVVSSMEERYKIMADRSVRNIQEYNKYAQSHNKEIMPYMVIIIDELADLMMTAGKEVEYLLSRLAQMARAAGIHLILATQRPSVDVITGLIKVNFLSRIAFKVTSKIDSRTILDCSGAERLLGKGDLLFLHNDGSLNRAHGCYVDSETIESVVELIKAQRSAAYQTVDVIDHPSYDGTLDESPDELYNDIITFIQNKEEISISSIQRAFKIGYNRSARIVEKLELEGHILPPDGSKMRKVAKNLEN